MSRINFPAVVIAFVAEIVADLVLSSLVIAYFAQGRIDDAMTNEEQRAAVEAIANSSPFLMTWFVFGTATTLGGGYLAARFAKTFPYFNGLAIGVLGLVLCIVFWGEGPTWYGMLALLTTLPASLYGAHLAKRHLAAAK